MADNQTIFVAHLSMWIIPKMIINEFCDKQIYDSNSNAGNNKKNVEKIQQ